MPTIPFELTAKLPLVEFTPPASPSRTGGGELPFNQHLEQARHQRHDAAASEPSAPKPAAHETSSARTPSGSPANSESKPKAAEESTATASKEQTPAESSPDKTSTSAANSEPTAEQSNEEPANEGKGEGDDEDKRDDEAPLVDVTARGADALTLTTEAEGEAEATDAPEMSSLKSTRNLPDGSAQAKTPSNAKPEQRTDSLPAEGTGEQLATATDEITAGEDLQPVAPATEESAHGPFLEDPSTTSEKTALTPEPSAVDEPTPATKSGIPLPADLAEPAATDSETEAAQPISAASAAAGEVARRQSGANERGPRGAEPGVVEAVAASESQVNQASFATAEAAARDVASARDSQSSSGEAASRPADAIDVKPRANQGEATDPQSNAPAKLNLSRLGASPGDGRGADQLTQAERVRFVQRVANAFHTAQDRGGEVRLRLSPPELGQMRLQVQMENGVLTARLEVETPQARAVVLENIAALRDRLGDQDVKLGNFDVDLMDRPSDGMREQHPGQDREGRAPREPRRMQSVTTTNEPAAPRGARPTGGENGLNVVI